MERYDAIYSLAPAHCGISFGQLLRGDGKNVEKSLQKLLKKTMGRVAALQDDHDMTDAPERQQKHDNRNEMLPSVRNCRLKMVETEVFGTKITELFVAGTLPNIMSEGLCHRLHLVPKQTIRRITGADGKPTRVLGEVKGVPTTFAQLTFLQLFLC